MNIPMHQDVVELLKCFAIGYLPGLLLGLVIWEVAKRFRAMPLFYADIVSFAAPLIIWLIMHRYHWTFSKTQHREACELMILGWIWSVCVIGRLLIPCFTHKLRFRLAAIHIGSICAVAAVLLALFYR